MYRIDDIGGLFASLPPNLQNAKNEAYCYALDRLFQKTVMYSKKIGILNQNGMTIWQPVSGLRITDQIIQMSRKESLLKELF